MKKKLIALMLAANCLTCAGVQAMTVSITDNKVDIATTADSDSISTLIVVKSGQSLSNNESVFAIKQAYADKDRNVKFSFNMPDKKNEQLTDGEYDIYIKQNGKEKKIDTFCYASVESRNKLIGEIKNADAEKLSEIINNESNLVVLKVLNFDVDRYNRLSAEEKEKVIIMTVSHIAENESENYWNSFKLALITNELNSSDNISVLLEDANLKFEEIAFSDMEDEKKTFIADFIRSTKFESVAELEKAYEQANALNIINNTRYDKMEETLSKYKDILGLSLTEYNKISNKIPVNEKIVTKLKSTPATSIDDLKKVISLSLIKENSNSSSAGTGSGQSSGGGSKSSSSQSGFASAIITNKDPENIPKKEVIYFNDLDKAEWAKEAINKMAESGIVSGNGNGEFRPNDVMTREEFVKMLVMAAGVFDENAECSFEDVSKEAWYYRYVASAYKSGIIYGVSDTMFGIGSKLTRQDMATICLRAADKSKEINLVRETKEFEDKDLISEYAKDAVDKLYRADVINGIDENNFAPLQTATRAQGALVIYKIFS